MVGSGALAAVLGVADTMEQAPIVKLTGFDWTRHARREELLTLLAGLRRAPLVLEGPHTALASPEVRARVAGIPALQRVILSLHGPPSVHDEVVSRRGAGVAVQTAAAGLAAAGVSVQINTVLCGATAATLAHVAALAREIGAAWRLLGFAPDALGSGGWAGRLRLPTLEESRRATASLDVAGLDFRVEMLPPCAVSQPLRPYVAQRDEARPAPWSGAFFGDECAGCATRQKCVGLSAAYVTQHGFYGAEAQLERPTQWRHSGAGEGEC
ncbi:MAG: hypothetical protein H6697_01065 [Myxococcales bacterium]|nr:hypothetical protein [Myxococcales bacterium]